MEFHHPPFQQLWLLNLLIQHAQIFDSFLWKDVLQGYSIDYIELFGNLQLPKKIVRKTTPLQRSRVKMQFYVCMVEYV